MFSPRIMYPGESLTSEETDLSLISFLIRSTEPANYSTGEPANYLFLLT